MPVRRDASTARTMLILQGKVRDGCRKRPPIDADATSTANPHRASNPATAQQGRRASGHRRFSLNHPRVHDRARRSDPPSPMAAAAVRALLSTETASTPWQPKRSPAARRSKARWKPTSGKSTRQRCSTPRRRKISPPPSAKATSPPATAWCGPTYGWWSTLPAVTRGKASACKT